jgi:hypothetical protein
MKLNLLILCALCVQEVGVSQTQNIVKNWTPATMTAVSGFPWGREGARTQQIFDGSLLTQPNVAVVIRDLFVCGDPTFGGTASFYEDIEITMGLTKKTAASMDRDWAVNNPNPTTVFRGPIAMNMTGNVWAGIGLPKAYTFWPGPNENLILDVTIWSAKTMMPGKTRFYRTKGCFGNQHRMLRAPTYTSNTALPGQVSQYGSAYGFLLGDGNFAVSGQGGVTSPPYKRVAISSSTWPQAGKPITISLDGAPFRTSYLAFGFQWGAFDLGLIGAPRSYVWFAPILQFPFVTDASGKAELTATIPASITNGTMYAQWYQLDPGAYNNTLGLTSSECGTFIFGN